MPVGALRALVLEANLAAHGVAVTVTRPAPDHDPVETTGIWLRPLHTEGLPVGTDLARREPKRVLVVPRATLTSMPRGTLISAPEETDGAVRLWRVEGYDLVESDYWQLMLLASD